MIEEWGLKRILGLFSVWDKSVDFDKISAIKEEDSFYILKNHIMPEERELTALDQQPIWANTEGFTAEDYLMTPSFSTVMEEYEGGAAIPEQIIHANTPILDQGRVGACSVFGITKAVNEWDFYDSKTILDAMKIWNDAVAKGIVPAGWREGWSMWGALKLMKDLGYIQGWYFCKTAEDVQRALYNKNICYTGTNQCDWYKTKLSHKLTPAPVNPASWHLFALNGIDMEKKEFNHANSWGERWADRGNFQTPFELMKYLYTIVAVVDKKTADVDKIISDETDSKKTVELRVWSGQNPDGNLEKLHAVFMVMRAFFEEFDNDSALALALKKGIVNNPTGELTRRDFLKMVFRAGYGNTIYEETIPEILKSLNVVKTLDNLDKPIKRYHASLVIARMLRNLGKIA